MDVEVVAVGGDDQGDGEVEQERNQSTGLRLSRADMTFFLPDWEAVDGAGWGG